MTEPEFNARNLHKFVIGELRTDGNKSQWLIGFEAYLKAEVGKKAVIEARIAAPKKRNRAEYNRRLRLKNKARRAA